MDITGALYLFCLYQTDVMFWFCLLNEPSEPLLLSHVCSGFAAYEFNRDEADVVHNEKGGHPLNAKLRNRSMFL